jgi:hypothetical protein
MISRIFTGAALTGILLATGCGGGSSSGSRGLTPAGPTISGSTGTSAISASFQIPYSASRAAAASSSRRPQYLSPGTTGLSALLGDGSVTATTGLSGTAQLTGSVVTAAGVTPATVTWLSASNTTLPVVGQTLTIADTTSPPGDGAIVSTAFTITTIAAGGTILTGSFAAGSTPHTYSAGDLVTFTPSGGAATGQQFILGNANAGVSITPAGIPAPGIAIPSTVDGASASSKVYYTFAPSTTPGYYTLSLNVTGLTAGIHYHLGVVTNDLGNNNFALSENEATIIAPAAGGTALAAFTLNPIVDGAYAPAATFVTPLPAGSAGTNPVAVKGTYETTLFLTDEMGYVIPTIGVPGTNSVAANAPAGATPFVTVATTVTGNLTFNGYAPPTTGTTIATTSLTTAPTGGALTATHVAGKFVFANTGAPGAGVDINNVGVPGFFGTYLVNVGTPTAPNTVPLTALAGNLAGTPINIICNTNSSGVAYQATIASVAPSLPVGYTYTASNSPAASTVINLGTVDCTPGIGGVIN